MIVRKGEMITLPSMPIVCLYKKEATRKKDRKNAVVNSWIGMLENEGIILISRCVTKVHGRVMGGWMEWGRYGKREGGE